MTSSVDYLETAKLEEIVMDLEAQGYQILRENKIHGTHYDLVARNKDGKQIAIEVKARSRLRTMAPQISALREQALQNGFEEFRLVVVNPPHETDVEIEGLADTLFAYLAHNTPPELSTLAHDVRLRSISAIDVDTVQITKGQVHILGDGVLNVSLTSESDLHWDFPITFDLWLDSLLQLYGEPRIIIDYSSFLDQSHPYDAKIA